MHFCERLLGVIGAENDSVGLYNACMASLLPIVRNYATYAQSAKAQYTNSVTLTVMPLGATVADVDNSIHGVYDCAMEVQC